jgi:hypothetical protein
MFARFSMTIAVWQPGERQHKLENEGTKLPCVAGSTKGLKNKAGLQQHSAVFFDSKCFLDPAARTTIPNH